MRLKSVSSSLDPCAFNPFGEQPRCSSFWGDAGCTWCRPLLAGPLVGGGCSGLHAMVPCIAGCEAGAGCFTPPAASYTPPFPRASPPKTCAALCSPCAPAVLQNVMTLIREVDLGTSWNATLSVMMVRRYPAWSSSSCQHSRVARETGWLGRSSPKGQNNAAATHACSARTRTHVHNSQAAESHTPKLTIAQLTLPPPSTPQARWDVNR